MQEIWKDIKGYEGLYQISNFGRVKSLDHLKRWGAKTILHKGKILKQQIIKTNGYFSVALSKKSKAKRYLVHRLVAQAFVENLKNYNVINHKDENKLNNNATNLEWCSYNYNNNYGNHGQKISETRNFNKNKKVYQYDLNGNLINIFKSSLEAKRFFKIKNNSITRCCRNLQKTAGGFIWKYKE